MVITVKTHAWVAVLVATLVACSVNSIAQPDLAPLRVSWNEQPVPGFLYLAPNCRVSPRPYGSFLGVYNVNGGVVKTGRVENYPFEYKVFPDGRLGFSELVVFAGASVPAGVYIVDTLFQTQKVLMQDRGYLTTQHDFHILPNGHRILLGAEDVTVDMGAVVDSGHPAANVVQAVIQEIDCDGKVVFQWKALDHLPITDSYENLAAPAIRYCHNNALWIDDDGNFLVSMRHTSQIIKIERATGNVMWILGGKRNQFTFINEHEENAPTYFSYQHDIRRLPNGHITLFDNGTQHQPQYSRGVEYEIDEVNKTCRMVWEYRHDPDYYVSIQGGMQTLDSGHRIIGWGSAASDGSAAVTEVDSNKVVRFEAFYPKQMFVYRATKFPVWPPGRASASTTITNVLQGETYNYHNNVLFTGVRVTYSQLSSFFYNSTQVRRFLWSPKDPQWNEEAPHLHQSRIELTAEGVLSMQAIVRVQADTLGITGDASKYVVYHRSTIDSGRFTRVPFRWDANTREFVIEPAQPGEFAFGIPSAPPSTPPMLQLLWPIGGLRVRENATHDLRVTPNGRVDAVRIQVASDKGMVNLLFDETTSSDRAAFAVGGAPQMLYWRALASAGSAQTAWTEVDSFRVSSAFLEITKPDDNATWLYDYQYPISWVTDIDGMVRIELVKDGAPVKVIADSVAAAAQGFLWTVSFDVPAGTDYQIRISSTLPMYSSVSALSAARIAISDAVSVVDESVQERLPVSVYPVPAEKTATFQNLGSGCAAVSLYSITGQKVLERDGNGTSILVDISGLPSGVYTALVTDTRGKQYRIAVPVQH